MEQVQTIKYNRVSLLSIAILIVLTWGFYRTYIIFFPSFEGFQFVHHFHGATMLLWMAILVVQPWLMSQNKFRIHKAIGKSTFVLAPILMVSIFLVARMTYHNNLKTLPTYAGCCCHHRPEHPSNCHLRNPLWTSHRQQIANLLPYALHDRYRSSDDRAWSGSHPARQFPGSSGHGYIYYTCCCCLACHCIPHR